MLKGVSKLIPPQLLKVLAEMGHGDEIVLADANFPGHSVNSNVIRLDGINIREILSAVLELIPLDTYAKANVMLMAVCAGDNYNPIIWETYQDILEKSKEAFVIDNYERFEFYENSKKAYCVVMTGEKSLYANIILKKGVIK